MNEILVGRWDCSSCGTRGVMGDAYRCHSCGAGRPDDVEFYLPDDAEVVKDAAKIAAAKAGSDWMCEYCRQWVAAVDKKCPNCAGGGISGSQRQESGAEVTPVACLKTDEEVDEEVERQAKAIRTERPAASSSAPPPATPERPVSHRNLGPIFGLVLAPLAIALVVWLCWFVFHAREAVAVVSGHSWSRVQHVEEYTALSQEGWDKPADAYNVRVERRVHHHDRVLDHYEDRTRIVYDRVPDGTERVRTGTRTRSLGNGRFSREPTYSTRTKYRRVARTERYRDPVYRSDPVYRDYYLYMVDRWVPGQDRREQGAGLEPRWPPTAVRDARQRMGSREEAYSISLVEKTPDPGEQARTWERSLDETAWRSWADDTVVVVTTRLGIVIDMRGAESGPASQ